MKKLAVLIVCTAVMASCDSFSGSSKDQLKAENDSLLMELTQRNAELDEMMGTFNDISEGFRQINAAESRVDLQRGAVAEGSLNAKQQIASDIEFIRKQMEENKEQIAKLQSMLKNSKTERPPEWSAGRSCRRVRALYRRKPRARLSPAHRQYALPLLLPLFHRSAARW